MSRNWEDTLNQIRRDMQDSSNNDPKNNSTEEKPNFHTMVLQENDQSTDFPIKNSQFTKRIELAEKDEDCKED